MHSIESHAPSPRLPRVAGLIAMALLAQPAFAEFAWLECGVAQAFAETDPAHLRQYAPDRKIDVSWLRLDVTPDFERRRVSGTSELQFQPIGKPLGELHLDAVDLTVSRVESTAPMLAHQVTSEAIIITFENPIPVNHEVSVRVTYEAEPKLGLYFRTPEMGYAADETHIWTQGEPIEARHWYPGYDYPNERFSTDMTCRVPEGMMVLSNGKRVAVETDPATGLVAWRWVQEKPHVNYLVTLVAGYFKKIETTHRGIPMAFYTPPSDIEYAENSFDGTTEMMDFFEQEIGVRYPWEKYDQIVVRDFKWGGMENTTATTLTDRTLFPDSTENIRSSEGLVAHELAHQWFGDYVTCEEWPQLWLNEGFATYYTHLFAGHKHGRDQMLYGLWSTAENLLGRVNDTLPIVFRKYEEPMQMFRQAGHLIYGKGGWVLHMLRSQLGADLYRQCVKTYLDENQLGQVTTEDLKSVMNELSGRNFDRFFDQWVHHGGYPELDVKYSWDAKTRLAKVSIAQKQTINDEVLLFHFPLTIRFHNDDGFVDKEVQINGTAHDFYFPLDAQPKWVRIDPEFTVLARIQFSPTQSMLEAQLRNNGDMMGRLLAVQAFGKKKDGRAIEQLKWALNNDPFHGVRSQAAQALSGIQNDEAFEALTESMDQPDARVRLQVVRGVTGSYRPEARDIALKVIQEEKNPDIVATALRSLGPYNSQEIDAVLADHLESDSFRNLLADAAVGAIRKQDSEEFIEPLMTTLRRDESKFTSRDFAEGLKTLAYLARNADEKEEIREFITTFTQSHKDAVQVAAIESLGSLGDMRAIAVVEKFTSAGDERVSRAAREALEALRAERKPGAELHDVRAQLLEFKESNEKLFRQLDDLQKKFDVLKTAPVEDEKDSAGDTSQ